MTTANIIPPIPDDCMATPEALVVVLFLAGSAYESAQVARQWLPMVPRVCFTSVEIFGSAWHIGRPSLKDKIAGTAGSLGIDPGKVILVGIGEAGRLAIDLALGDSLPTFGVIAFDIAAPSELPHSTRSNARIRLVQHASDEDPEGVRFGELVAAMRRRDIDYRATLLPPNQGHERMMRAGAAYLVELVAMASTPHGKRIN